MRSGPISRSEPLCRTDKMHSHHSHSGDYVSHAKDKLDDIVALAAKKGFTIFCLTEHMPRLEDRFLYPEEIDKRYTVEHLNEDFANYLDHACALQQKYNASLDMKILVGFEVEGIDDDHIERAVDILHQDHRINMSVGSVHYVNQIPIDFDRAQWLDARNSIPERTTRALYHAFFELQFKVIQRIHPNVIGHFDLIRLFQPHEEIDPTTNKRTGDIVLETDWPEVWHLVTRNIQYAASYGALFELNSAAFRKGWLCPYPQLDICNAIKQYGGARFCLLDDSHGLDQVGLNYSRMWSFIKNELKLDIIYHLALDGDGHVVVEQKLVTQLDKLEFWQQ